MVVLSLLGSSLTFVSSNGHGSAPEEAVLSHLTPYMMNAIGDVARLSGAEELPSGDRLNSRSVFHDDLVKAEEYVLDERLLPLPWLS